MPEVVVEDDVDDMNIIVVVVVVPVEDDVVAAVSAPVDEERAVEVGELVAVPEVDTALVVARD